jgi:hypothetical protein
MVGIAVYLLISGRNKLPVHKRIQILAILVEGCCMRWIARVADVSINNVRKNSN